jgi:general secretion pathway protein D
VKLLNRWSILTAALLTVSIAHAGPAAAAPIVSFSPTPGTTGVGGSVFLDLGIADVTDLFAYQFEITFDPGILQVGTASDGGFLTSGGGISVFGGAFTLVLDNTAGIITVLDALLGPAPPASGVSGAGTLATLVFTGLAAGTSGILFSSAILEDSFGVPIDAVLSAGQVTVTGGDGGGPTPVPEPATLSLVALGLACAGFSRRQRLGRQGKRR